MNDREADSGQCKTRREADRKIQQEIGLLGDEREAVNNRASDMRRELSNMRSELGRLRAAQIAALGLSASRRAGPSGSSVEMRFAIEINVLEARIQDKEIQLQGEEIKLVGLRDKIKDLTSKLGENARYMRQLNCVLP